MNRGVFSESASLIRRAAALKISARMLADGMKSGCFRSLSRGRGIEFSGVREYLKGDDVRAIDWNVTARMGKPFVKLFAEERDISVFLVVDRSLSMQLPTAAGSRFHTAGETAALLAFSCGFADCRLGAVLFDGDITFSCRPKDGGEQIMEIVSRLDEIPENTIRGSVLPNALTGAARILKNRSLIFVLSDFRAAGWERPLGILAAGHDTVAVLITDNYDYELPDMGSSLFEDPETGRRLFLPVSSAAFRRVWKEDGRNRVNRWQEACLRRGVSPVVISTQDDPAKALMRFFSQRGRP